MNSGINSKTEKIFQFFWTAFFILITVKYIDAAISNIFVQILV